MTIPEKVLAEQGYYIVAFKLGPKPLLKVGEVTDGPLFGGAVCGETPGRFLVCGEATASEWINQAAKYGGQLAAKSAKRKAIEAIGFFRLKPIEEPHQ